MVITDCFSRWPEVYFIIPGKETVSDDLRKEWMSQCEVPKKLHSNWGHSFGSGVFEEVCRGLDVDAARMTPFQHQSSGLMEWLVLVLQ